METESIESGILSGADDPLPKSRPAFPPIKKEKLADGSEVRKIPVPTCFSPTPTSVILATC